MTSPFERRLAACRRRLAAIDAALAVLFPSPNLTYLSGFDEPPSERHLLLFVPRDGDPAFVAPELYADQLAATPVDDVRTYADDADPLVTAQSVLADRDLRDPRGRVLVDDRMWARFSQDLRRVLPDASFGLASEAVAELRVEKDAVELDALRRAGELADRVSRDVRARGSDVVGLTERELASEIDRSLEACGGHEPAFPTIVASGPNGARPHHHAGDRRIEPGDPVVIDFGAFVDADLESGTNRYPGDQTRTIVFGGDPPDEYERVHAVVERAQRVAVETVEPGVTASAVDRAAREVIEEAGYGDAFLHRTGHGVGLEVHEPPYVVAGNDRALEPGMVFSVEPGIYLEGRFGVRVEDLVAVTDDGAERLNDSPRGWRADSNAEV